MSDGRSKACRRVIEESEERFAASGAHAGVECVCFLYMQPDKKDDPRIPGRQLNYTANNCEIGIYSLPFIKKGHGEIVQRAEFNSCGEVSTSSKTYSGVPIRRYCELPRMDSDTKEAIMGVNLTADVVTGKRVQRNISKRGHPYSHCEVKPLNLWQRILEHNQATHIVDFTVGSGALAIAASGRYQYEGICANQAHMDWLDSIMDKCIMYMAGADKAIVHTLGGDDVFVEKCNRYFAGTMLDARRLLGPDATQDAAERGSETADDE